MVQPSIPVKPLWHMSERYLKVGFVPCLLAKYFPCSFKRRIVSTHSVLYLIKFLKAVVKVHEDMIPNHDTLSDMPWHPSLYNEVTPNSKDTISYQVCVMSTPKPFHVPKSWEWSEILGVKQNVIKCPFWRLLENEMLFSNKQFNPGLCKIVVSHFDAEIKN